MKNINGAEKKIDGRHIAPFIKKLKGVFASGFIELLYRELRNRERLEQFNIFFSRLGINVNTGPEKRCKHIARSLVFIDHHDRNCMVFRRLSLMICPRNEKAACKNGDNSIFSAEYTLEDLSKRDLVPLASLIIILRSEVCLFFNHHGKIS